MRTSAALARSVSLAVAILAVVSRPALANPIIVTTGPAAAAMVSNLVGNNSGITVTSGSEVYVGAAIASGLFTGAGGILPFSNGIVLTSGDASRVPGPNNSTNCCPTSVNNTASDPDLNALSPGTLYGDAATLTFKFKTTSDVISFQYVFGSEEYPEFVGLTFNDVFGFFLDGVNIALIPNTTTPVAINNVNAGTNSQYFTNNAANIRNIQYDGLVGVSIPLFASATVTPNVEHTIKFGVEDVGETNDIPALPSLRRDSGVMLAAGSFASTPPPTTVPEPATLLTIGPGLLMFARRIRRRRNAG